MDANELRALADAQPVAIVGEQRSGAWAGTNTPVGYVWSPPSDASTKMLFPLADLPLGTKLYTHPAPAVPAIEERGPWSAGQDKQQPWEQRVWIESDDFTHDVRLYVNGDFESGDQRFAYAQEIARRLNAAPAAPQAEPETFESELRSFAETPEQVAFVEKLLASQAEPKEE